MCETVRVGLSACTALATNAEYCADASCLAAIMNVEAAWSQCQDDPAMAPLWADLVGICDVQDCSGAMTWAWEAPLLDGELTAAARAGFTFFGDAHLDGNLGLAMDGDGDYAMIAAPDYTSDGEFSIELWFSRSSECRSDSDWEFLFSQGEFNSTNLGVSVICDNVMVSPDGQVLAESGTVVTTILQDDNGQFAQFDWSLSREAPKLDAVTSEWTHMILAVSANSIKAYADGHAVGQYGYHIWSVDRVVTNNPAQPDPTTLRMPMAGYTMADPNVYVGSGRWGGNFRGNMAGLAIYGDAVDQVTASCRFQTGRTAVGVCPIPSTIPGAVWFGDFLGGVLPTGAAAVGNAYLDPEFGITVDGDNDYVTIVNQDFATSGTFSVSFWFTRQGECNIDNRYEYLFSQTASTGGSSYDSTGVFMILGCEGQAYGADAGDILRIILVDDAGTRGTFDAQLSDLGTSGFVVNQWVHVALSVSSTGATVYLDGVRAGPPPPPPGPDNHIGQATCTPTVTITATDGIMGYTTYQLNVGLPATGKNVYSISGNIDGPMTVAKAYQVPAPFGANVGGTNPAFLTFQPNIAYDSWLTVGMTDASNTGALSTIGVDFSTWSTAELSVSNGAVFWMDPDASPDGDAVVAQLTVDNPYGTLATMTLQGRSLGTMDDWTCRASFSASTWSSWRTTPCTAAGSQECNNLLEVNGQPTSGVPFGTFSLAGRDIVLAGQAGTFGGGGRMFFGSMAGVSLFNTPLEQAKVRCLYYYDAERVGTCTDIIEWRETVWSNSFMGSSYRMPKEITLQGDAYLDGKFGLQLDGEGDYATIDDVPAFAADGTFGIALWFFKASDCDVPEQFEFLYSTVENGWQSDSDRTRPWEPSYRSGIHMYLGCADQGQQSTVNGNVLRTWLVDNQGTRATFDYSLSAAAGGGAVTDGWIHVILGVQSTELTLYIDGQAADSSAIGYSRGSSRSSGGNWDGTDFNNQNAAYPNIGNLNPPLSGFDVSEVYRDFSNYTYTTYVLLDDPLNAKAVGPCVFPFVYEGTTYNACTTDWNDNGVAREYAPWCATTPEIGQDADGQWSPWGMCGPTDQVPVIAYGPGCERYVFTAMDDSTDGWHGGHWEVALNDQAGNVNLVAGGRVDGQLTSAMAEVAVAVSARPNTIVAFGPACDGDDWERGYVDDNVEDQTVTLPAGTTYYMHTGEGSWDGSFWTVMDPSGAVIAGGDPTFGCCDAGTVENVTPMTTTAGGEYTIRISTFHRSGIQWVLDETSTKVSEGANPLGDWARRPCFAVLPITINTHRYAGEMSWTFSKAASYTVNTDRVCGGRNEICTSDAFPCNTAVTVEACRALCDADDNCVSFEFGGGDGVINRNGMDVQQCAPGTNECNYNNCNGNPSTIRSGCGGDGICFQDVAEPACAGRSWGERVTTADGTMKSCFFDCDNAGVCVGNPGARGWCPPQDLGRCQLSTSCDNSVARNYNGWSLVTKTAATTAIKGPKAAPVYLGARHDVVAQGGNPSQWTYFLGNIAGVYMFRRPLESDQATCLFRGGEAQIGVCKVPAEMRGSVYYGEMLDGTAPAGTTLNGAAYLDGAFGARLGGVDDSINIDILDYSSRGRFTIAFWMTQTTCRIPGQFEMVYSHQNHRGSWFSGDNANIHIYALCTEEGGHSTLGGSVIRTVLVDDTGQRGSFDWSLRSAKSGGFVTDSWLHLAMAYSRDGVTVYVDGEALDSISDRQRYGLQLRDLVGSERDRLDDDDKPTTLADAIGDCGSFCKAQGYSYFGLQWTSECFCDNSYGSFGQANQLAADNADGLPGCDVDGDGTPDCGFGKEGVAGRMRCRGEGADETCEREMACSWRNAVYNNEGLTPRYTGCFMDGSRPTTCAEATDCETCALMVDQGCGWDGGRRGTGTCVLGGYTASWECSVAEYGFARDAYRSNSNWWYWSETEENVLWPDPTSVRKESCRGSYSADGPARDACSAVTLGEAQTEANCRAVNSNFVGIAQEKNWADAEAYCQATFSDADTGFTSHLASIHSDAAQANAVLACADVSDDVQCWIGLNDVATEGTFVWTDGTPLDVTTNWAPGEPNDWNPAPDCATSDPDRNRCGAAGVYDPNNLIGEDAIALWHGVDNVCTRCTQEQQLASEVWNDMSNDREMPFVCQTAPSNATSETPSCVYNPDIELGGLTLDEVYPGNSDIYITDLTMSPGVHILTARANWGYGWHGGYWEVIYSDASGNNVTQGGPVAGDVTGSQGYGFINVPPTNGGDTNVTMHIRTGWTGSDISWAFDETAGGGPLYSGPKKGTITIGGSLYEGSVAGVTIMASAIDEDDADCLYRDGEGKIQICATADMLAQERKTSYYGSFTAASEDVCGGGVQCDGQGDGPCSCDPCDACFDVGQGTTLNGDAYIDRDFGVQLDGDGDFITIAADWRTAAYGNDGTFGIAMWFTKGSECLPSLGENTFATLYSHARDSITSSGGISQSRSVVQIQVGCDSSSQHSTAAGDGDIIRVMLADADGNKALFDVAMDAARSGNLVLDEWVHLIVTVKSDQVLVYLDGLLINQPLGPGNQPLPGSSFGYPVGNCGGCESWAMTSENRAFMRAGYGYAPLLTVDVPDVPDTFTLGDFQMFEIYSSNTEYNFTMWMTPGEHMITTEDRGGPNQWHGGSWKLVESNRDLDGLRQLISDDDVNAGRAQQVCAQVCRDAGFQYMGLQWTSVCMCDNEYGSRGQASDYDCDMDNDGRPDCGTMGIADLWVGPQNQICNWRNAIFDLNRGGARPTYLGCFVDSEDDDGGAVVAEGVGGDDVSFAVPYPAGVYGLGPVCGERYHDFDNFDQVVTLPAGVSYVHAGGRAGQASPDWVGDSQWSCNWLRPTRTPNQYACNDGSRGTGWRYCADSGISQCPPERPWMCANPTAWRNSSYACSRTEADCDQDGGLRECPADLHTYWTLWSVTADGQPGAVLAGGQTDGTCCSQPQNPGEQITRVEMAAETTAVLRLSTLSLNNVKWYINDSPQATCTDPWCWDSCSRWSSFDKEYVFHVNTGTQRAWDIGWKLDNGNRFMGPKRSEVVIGADSNYNNEFEGSVAEIMILRDTVDDLGASCIFGYGETQVGVCVPQDQMRSRDFFETMLRDNDARYGSRDMNGDHGFFYDADGDGMEEVVPDYVDNTDAVRTEAQAVALCATLCGSDYQYVGLQWSSACWCDNDYGARGELTNGECNIDDSADGSADCGQGVAGCGQMNAVYDTQNANAYVGCYADSSDPVGVSFMGDAFNSAEYGVHLDGRGDYITIDPVGQQVGRSYQDNYSNDGSWTVSFWFWKRACTSLGGYEWLFSHQNNNDDIYNEPSPTAVWQSVPLMIASEQERLDWIASDPDLDDLNCQECGSYPMFLSLDMDHGHRDVDVHRTVQSYMAWKYPGMTFGAWKPGASMGDQRTRALFVEGGQVRSEQSRQVTGYATILLTDDLVQNTNVNMFLGCSEKGVDSTINGDIMRTVLVDDEGNRATFDWGINEARSGGLISDGWIHVAMTLDSGQNSYGSIGVYVDGVRLERDSFGFKPIADTATWTEIPVSIISEQMRLMWIANDDDVSDISCRECDNAIGADNLDGRIENIQYPMYLALDERNADATVDSYMAAFMPDTSYTNWKRGNQLGTPPGRAMWKDTGRRPRFRSENERPVNAYASIFVTTDISWTVTSRNLAYPDPNRLNSPMTGFAITQPVYMGVKADLDCNTYYLGHIAEVSLWRNDLTDKEVDCLNRDVADAGVMGVCKQPSEMDGSVFTRDFLYADRTELWGVEIGGDAVVDPERGLQFDGDGDFAKISWGRRSGPYGDGPFTISFWFSRQACHSTPGRFEHLYSHIEDNAVPLNMGAYGVAMTNSNVNMMIGCDAAGDVGSSLAGKDVLRTTMQDTAGTYVSFDFSLSDTYGQSSSGYRSWGWDNRAGADRGLALSTWANVALRVDGTNVALSMDGGVQSSMSWAADKFGYQATDAMLPKNVAYDSAAAGLVSGDLPTVDTQWTFDSLRTALGAFDFAGQQAYLGMKANEELNTGFTGGMTGVAIFRRALTNPELGCLYNWGEVAIQAEPVNTAVPVTTLMGQIVDGCVGVGST